MAEWTVTAEGQLKGTIYRSNGRWVWARRNGGVDTWPKATKQEEVLSWIARVCQVDRQSVALTASQSDPHNPGGR
jgi:hypothetical protein